MGNFKVRVNNEAESKEAQELFQKLLGKENGFITIDKSIRWVVLYQGHVAQYEFLPSVELNEITLPELRAMVNPSLKDQYLEQGKKINDACASVFKKQDDLLDAILNQSPMGINDQYAEIEQVRQTLNERQSQYGEFANVAETTATLMDQFALGRMSYVQREALHMICSKLARIANGDPNHVDSWHDIAGYATLVVDDLES